MEPVSTLLGICIGQVFDLTKELGASVGEVFADDKVKSFARSIKHRLKTHLPLPKNHDLVREIRSAELVAARRVERAYLKRLDNLPSYEKSREQAVFAARLDDFLSARLKIHSDGGIDFQALSQQRIDHVLDEMINVVVIEGAADGAAASRRKIESDFLAEIARETDCKIPSDFLDFFTGADSSIQPPQGGWYDMVALYITEEIKENERFKSIFFATELVDIKRLVNELNAHIAAFTSQGIPSIGAEVKELLRGIKGDTEQLLAGQQSLSLGMAEVLTLLRSGGTSQRAAEQGISETALRRIAERLRLQGAKLEDLIPLLEQWIEDAVREPSRRTNEGEAYEAASQEAERRLKAGRTDEAADAFMEEFERERKRQAEQESESRRKQIRLLEGAIRYAALAFNEPAIAPKLRVMAKIEGIDGADATGEWLFAKAAEFYEIGDSKGSNPDLFIAISAYRAALEERTQARVPLDWAMTQNNLGNALAALGERESGTARLEEAVQAYRAALQEYTQARVPLDWAMTQNNLGAALATLGERESGTARLEEAVQAYRAALQERTQTRVPPAWAETQYNLANALAALAGRQKSAPQIAEALACMNNAVDGFTQCEDHYRLPIAQARVTKIQAALAALQT